MEALFFNSKARKLSKDFMSYAEVHVQSILSKAATLTELVIERCPPNRHLHVVTSEVWPTTLTIMSALERCLPYIGVRFKREDCI